MGIKHYLGNDLKKWKHFKNKYIYNNEQYKILCNKKSTCVLHDEKKKNKYIFLENYELTNINKCVININNDINNVIHPNISYYDKYRYNKIDFLKYIYIYDNIRNIYNNKYYDNIKKNNNISIVDFLNCSKQVYYYHQVIDGVYVVHINNYKQQIYESFLLYQYLLDRSSFYNNLSHFSSDQRFNASNYIMKSLTFIKENKMKEMNNNIYIKEPHLNEPNIMSMEDIKYYEKLNKQIINDNILLLDIFLSTYHNIYNNSKMELKNAIKKFSTFNTLGEYINYIQQNENLTYDNIYNFVKERNKKNLFLYIYKNEHITNQYDQSNFYHLSLSYNNSFYYKHYDNMNLIDLISYNNNVDNNICLKKL